MHVCMHVRIKEMYVSDKYESIQKNVDTIHICMCVCGCGYLLFVFCYGSRMLD